MLEPVVWILNVGDWVPNRRAFGNLISHSRLGSCQATYPSLCILAGFWSFCFLPIFFFFFFCAGVTCLWHNTRLRQLYIYSFKLFGKKTWSFPNIVETQQCCNLSFPCDLLKLAEFSFTFISSVTCFCNVKLKTWWWHIYLCLDILSIHFSLQI